MTAAPKIELGTAVGRGLRLRCPRCGEGRLFRNLFVMNEQCPNCHLVYERAPGYFLGSAYINYGATALLLTSSYVGLHFGADISNRVLAAPLLAFCIIFPLIAFRFARSLWLALDCYFDVTGFDPRQE